MRRSAHIEAERHLRKGLAVLATMGETVARNRLGISLQNALGVCLMPTRGFGNPEVANAFESAAAIARTGGRYAGLVRCLARPGTVSDDLGGPANRARSGPVTFWLSPTKIDDPGFLIEAHHLGWSTLAFTGDFAAAREHAERGMALYDRERDHRLTYQFSGHDPGMCCRSFGSLAVWQLGYPDTALAMCRDGLALAEAVSHPFSVTIALWGMGILSLLRRDTGDLRVTGETMIAHCQEKGFAPFIPMGKILRGGALAAEGVARARHRGHSGRHRRRTLQGDRVHRADILCVDGRAVPGRWAAGAGLDRARRRAGHVGEECGSLQPAGIPPAEGRVPVGIVLAEPSPTPKPASGRPSRSPARRTARCSSCARRRAWHASGPARNRRAEARGLLAPICGWFTEGLETKDLRDAKELLEQFG